MLEYFYLSLLLTLNAIGNIWINLKRLVRLKKYIYNIQEIQIYLTLLQSKTHLDMSTV